MNFIILPKWLCETLTRLGKPLETALDLDALRTILSPEDVLIYSLSQHLITMTGHRHPLIKGLSNTYQYQTIKGMPEGLTQEQHVQMKLTCNDMDEHDSIAYLLIHGAGPGEALVKPEFKPCLVGKDVLGLVPEIKDTENNVVLYEDVFNILQQRSDYSAITKTPLYESYVNMLCNQSVA